MYSERVMEHFQNPRNVGEMESPDGIGHVGNPVCGDIMELYIKVKDDIVIDAKFKTFGCGAAIATSSMVTEMVKGKTIEQALKISNKAVAEALDGLPPIKMHCSALAEEALRLAIEDYLAKSKRKKITYGSSQLRQGNPEKDSPA
ncbi:Fe-S cluster assembly scaffold protein NifU [Candidatus Bipolaricaulota bacterium]|nr:Fe-S cluster assembly scaffold protein NifU [Candidatus Bipolaricaulota bacterium]